MTETSATASRVTRKYDVSDVFHLTQIMDNYLDFAYYTFQDRRISLSAIVS